MEAVGLVGAGGDLDEAELADDGLGAADLVDVDGDFELVERGADAVGGMLVRLADDGHARGVGALRLADRERDDVDVETAEERGDAGEHAGFVLNEGYESVEHLLVLRGFEERIFFGPADHLVEGGAGGDHRVDAVFLLDLEVDEEGLAAGAGLVTVG